MATTVFNLSAVDRIEADVKLLDTKLDTQANAIAAIARILTDFISSLGIGDQPSIDAVTAALRDVTNTLSATVERDKDN